MRIPLQVVVTLIVAAALAWLGSKAWTSLTQPAVIAIDTPRPPRQSSPTALPESDLRVPAINEFTQTLARPVFADGRRPPTALMPNAPRTVAQVASPPPSVPIPSLERYRLLGIVAVSDDRRALIETPSGGRQWRGEAEMIDEWTIVTIGAEKVDLKSRAGGGELRLYPSLTK